MLTADPTEDLLIDAYLAPWKESVFTDGLPTLLQQAIALLPVHSALKFARFLKHGYDTQWDMTGAVPSILSNSGPSEGYDPAHVHPLVLAPLLTIFFLTGITSLESVSVCQSTDTVIHCIAQGGRIRV